MSRSRPPRTRLRGGRGATLNHEHLITLGALTLLISGSCLYFAPPEKRLGFLFHTAIVTVLTVLVITVDR